MLDVEFNLFLAILFIWFSTFVVIPVVPALFVALICGLVMNRVTFWDAMKMGVLASIVASVGWGAYALFDPCFWFLIYAPPVPCLVMAFVSGSLSLALCYWLNARRILSSSQSPDDLSGGR